MDINDLYNKVAQGVDEKWSDLYKMRYIYLTVGKYLIKNTDFFYSVDKKLGSQNLNINELSNIYNDEKNSGDLKVICKSAALILKYLFSKFNIESKLVQSTNKIIAMDDNENLDIYHWFLAAKDKDTNQTYFMTLISDLPYIKLNMSTKHFGNNISYLSSNADGSVTQNYQGEEIDYNNLNSLDKWILAKTDALIKDTDAKYDSFEFGEVARSIYNFTWDDFASKYLEMTKVDFALGDEVHKRNTCAILTKVLVTILKLLHPFMPFVTEEIYQNFYDDSITVSEWPKPTGIEFDNDEIMATDKLFEIITTIRNVRNKKNVAMSKKINVAIETSSNYLRNFLLHHKEYLAKFTNYVSLKIDKDVEHDDSVVSVLDDVNVVIPLKELINIEEEIIKLKARIAKLVADILRSEGMLNNPNFVAKAPAQKVEAEKNNVASYKEQLKEAEKVLKGLEK